MTILLSKSLPPHGVGFFLTQRLGASLAFFV
jgi:hypothetical protein